jgi:hypothetical protein
MNSGLREIIRHLPYNRKIAKPRNLNLGQTNITIPTYGEIKDKAEIFPFLKETIAKHCETIFVLMPMLETSKAYKKAQTECESCKKNNCKQCKFIVDFPAASTYLIEKKPDIYRIFARIVIYESFDCQKSWHYRHKAILTEFHHLYKICSHIDKKYPLIDSTELKSIETMFQMSEAYKKVIHELPRYILKLKPSIFCRLFNAIPIPGDEILDEIMIDMELVQDHEKRKEILIENKNDGEFISLLKHFVFCHCLDFNFVVARLFNLGKFPNTSDEIIEMYKLANSFYQ